MMKRLPVIIIKDLILGIKDIFIILELVFSVVIMLLLLLIVPEDIRTEGRVYIYDQSGLLETFMLEKMPDSGKKKGEFFVDSRDELIAGMVKDKNSIGLIIQSDGSQAPYHIQLYRQPYTRKTLEKWVELEMEDLFSIIAPPSGLYPADIYKSVRIEALRRGERDSIPFNRRMLPPVLLMMIGMMGLFAMVSLIGQERIDSTIRAFRLTPAGLWQFLLSKHLVLLLTGFLTFSIIYLPMMGWSGYLLSLLIVELTVLAGSSAGVLLGTFYDSPMKAIGWVLVLMLILGLPVISLYSPAFSPAFLRLIPSFYTLFGLDAAMFPDENSHLISQSLLVLSLVAAALTALSTVIFIRLMRKEA